MKKHQNKCKHNFIQSGTFIYDSYTYLKIYCSKCGKIINENPDLLNEETK
jgi:hypothetical protein